MEDVLIAKYNTNGVLQWQKALQNSFRDYGNDIEVDSSGNVYVVGTSRSMGPGQSSGTITKLNTSGTVQWQRTFGVASPQYNNGNCVAVDSNGNVYIGAMSSDSSNNMWYAAIIKYNSSGTLQWTKFVGNNGVTNYISGITIDSSDNIYVTGVLGGSGNSPAFIAKLDTSGTVQWQRTLSGSFYTVCNSITVDSSANVYVCGYTDISGAGYTDAFIIKYNTSGTIQWQRTFGSSVADGGNDIKADSSGNIYIVGTSDSFTAYTYPGYKDIFVAKLPNDGSNTGSFVVNGRAYVYATSSLTNSTSSLTFSTAYLTTENNGPGAINSSYTTSTSTITSSVAYI